MIHWTSVHFASPCQSITGPRILALHSAAAHPSEMIVLVNHVKMRGMLLRSDLLYDRDKLLQKIKLT
jgi:hypothetical protein